jgi:hypothetical protein
MVKFNISGIYGLSKDNWNIKIKSKRIKQKRNKYMNSINKLKKKFINRIKNRYDFLENNLDKDLITGCPIYLENIKNLHIFNINEKQYGIGANNYLKWFNHCRKFDMPKNILTNKKISIREYEELLNKCKEYYSINKTDELQIEIEKGEKKLLFYKHPIRMLFVISEYIDSLTNEISDYILINYFIRIPCICEDCIYNLYNIDNRNHIIRDYIYRYESMIKLFLEIEKRFDNNYYN